MLPPHHQHHHHHRIIPELTLRASCGCLLLLVSPTYMKPQSLLISSVLLLARANVVASST